MVRLALPLCIALGLLGGAADAQCQHQKLLASDGLMDEKFGEVVAIDGTTLVIGSPFDADKGFWAGSIYVFELQGGTWAEVGNLYASDADVGDRFGFSLAIEGDIIVAGTRYNQDAGYGSGSVYVFERSGGIWSETAKLVASDQKNGQFFGQSVDVSGTTIVVGAHLDDLAGPGTGAAYVFDKSGSTWSETQKLTASDPTMDDRFGYDVSISGDVCVIGAFGSDVGATTSGAAYTFERSGGTWSETDKLLPSDPSAGKRFGSAVAVEGTFAIIGAQTDDHAGSATGAAYSFERQSDASWTQLQKLTASDAASDDLFGDIVDIDGNQAVISAWSKDTAGPDSGAAYVFVRTGSLWSEAARLVPTDVAALDNFGSQVGISGDIVIAGARHDDDLGAKSGSAYVWSVSGTGCPSLYGAPAMLRVADGGTHFLTVDAGSAFAGHFYYLLGSTSGTTPGFPFGGFTLPLNPDPYFNVSLREPNLPPLDQSFAVLDVDGTGLAKFVLPPGVNPLLVGAVVHHAYGVIDPVNLNLEFVSVAVSLDLL